MKLEDSLLRFEQPQPEPTKEEADRRTLRTIMALQAMFGTTVKGFDGEVIKRFEASRNDTAPNGKTEATK